MREDNLGLTSTKFEREMQTRLLDCVDYVKLSRERAVELGTTFSHSGYRYPKYRYFSSNFGCTSSGLDKLIADSDRISIRRE